MARRSPGAAADSEIAADTVTFESLRASLARGSGAAAEGLAVFYPAAPSTKETGARRGSALLCRRGSAAEAMVDIGIWRRG